ncbi:GerMN domain-containing protein [Paenibacillus macerans]|uniref:GerMN domain-containing protein n=1 Tax=Paenibacillus macerans TaxID=44252 RepID=UPI00203BF27E|nr:GerMN domain-containing protein [Paenibacillus macerans]MCM3701626.1 GerMN domain-containing protein [Paenibacillus macerans]
MTKKGNRVSIVVLALSLLFIISSCGSNFSESHSESTNSGAETKLSNSSEKLQKREIEVYATDDEMTKVYPLMVEIRYTSVEEKIGEALKALAAVKADGKMGLWSGVVFTNVALSGGELTVDVHMPDMSHLGAPGEALALEAIQKTVFQFDEVQSFDLLVDGEAVSSLMGHLELEHPIKRNKE